MVPYLIMGGEDEWLGVGAGWMSVNQWYLTSLLVVKMGGWEWVLGG